MALDLVIENAGLDNARAVIDRVSIRQYELRGWVAVGFTSEPTRDPVLTDVEQAAQDAADAERLALLESDAASATSRPKK
jgi:hypothetical protein